MKLQARLALAMALAAAIAILLIAGAISVLTTNQQRNDVDQALIRVVSEPRELLEEFRARGGGRGRPQRGGDQEAGRPEDRLFTRIRVVLNGEVVVDEGLPDVGTVAPTDPEVSTIEIDGDRYRMAVAGLRNRDGVIQVARNIEDLESGLGRLRRQTVLASVIGIALAGLAGALVARRLTAPITEVANAAKAMATRNDLPEPIDVTRSDEVGDLASSFNQMLAALALSRDQQHRLVADASHELRTPLTSLRLKLDLLDATPDLPEEQRQELLSISALEVEKLGELVTELVDLATDPTGVEEEPTSQSLSQLVRDVATPLSVRAGRTITVMAVANAPEVLVRDRMVRRAVSNLIDNAVKYSPEDAPISISIDGSRIEVRDHGEGIPDADLEHVFDRFYRSPSARTRPGNGIGLAIVQRVADLHGGDTWARNETDPPGAVVGFSVAPT